MKFYITTLLLLLTLNSRVQSQFLNSEVTANAEIKAILQSESGGYYYINSFDVSQRKSSNEYYIQDKSNLLNGCFVFVAKDSVHNSSLLFGIYKEGDILWNSRSFFCGESIIFAGDIWQIRNLKPNKVYIIFQLPYIPDGSESNLWVVYWDGVIGEVVNEVDNEDFSTIYANTNSVKILDYDGDGVEEILATQTDSTIYDIDADTTISYLNEALYTWVGNTLSDYGVLLPENLPKDRLDATINNLVIFQNDIFTYEYNVGNSENSIQSIQTFALDTDIDSIISKYVPSKWVCFNSIYSMIIFTIDPIFIDENCKIIPGQSGISFSFSNKELPSIVKYYIQGYNGGWNDFNNLKNNSKIGYTIGPNLNNKSLNSDEFIDSLISYNQHCFEFNWITHQFTATKYDSLFNLAKTQLQQNNNNGARVILQTLLQQIDIDSASNLTSEAYALLRYNTEYLLEKIPQTSPNLVVNLKNSLGNQIPASNVKYYEGSWKDAVNNGDGTFTVITTRPTVSIRVYYEYASKQADNINAQSNTYTFITVNAAVQLKNSLGNLINAGTVQYYAGAWRSFGTTSNGVAYKELLPINYSFRMTYEYGSIDKQQNLSSDPTVVFQTVNAAVQLKNSLGNLIDLGTVQYYAGAWRSFGTTSNGVSYKELLPVNYSFRMTHEFVSNDKQQNLSTTPVVDFNTVLCTVKVSKISNNEPINNAAVKYYAGAWRNLGTTDVNGITTKELLPANIIFRATSGSVSLDKQQDISVNNLVEILLNVP